MSNLSNEVRIHAQAGRMVLSSENSIFKTERFIKETARAKGIDSFVAVVGEAVVLGLAKIKTLPANGAYRAITADGEHTLFFSLGGGNTGVKDIVFFRYVGREGAIKKSDLRFASYLHIRKEFDLVVKSQIADFDSCEMKKLYRLSGAQSVNLPLLNPEQKKIVYLEDKNVLVQGSAGSGKTNVCIDKIVFTACRAYAGRILYSTFSRGLLIDTEERVNVFIDNLQAFLEAYRTGAVEFVGKDHKKAIENKLGIYFTVDDDDKIAGKVERVVDFLKNKVDYRLPEDIYREYFPNSKATAVGEGYFVKDFIEGLKNHQLLSRMQKLRYISPEVIYKEIFGLILGTYKPAVPDAILTLERYTELRSGSFTTQECESIYLLAKELLVNMEQNNLIDNNIISRKVLSVLPPKPKYSLAIIDEVQDLTEVNLNMLRAMTRKMFCVGDALQMINPSYFSFGYLKRLLFEKDVVDVEELSNNYRSTVKIAEIIEKLGDINLGLFGTHSFVLSGASVESNVKTTAVYINDSTFIDEIDRNKFENVTVICSGTKEKEALRKRLPRQEILTVSEAKGLERETVVAYNILSDSFDKWEALKRQLINRKKADENSVYRYYFNLFYVGVSRARANVYVVEKNEIDAFASLFKEKFEKPSRAEAISILSGVASKQEIDQDEILRRVEEFIKLGQYENARFACQKLDDELEKTEWSVRIDVNEKYITHGMYRNAGVAYWKSNMPADAVRMFKLSGDEALIKLMDAINERSGEGLDIEILKFFDEYSDNDVAMELVMQVITDDLREVREKQREINKKYRTAKENKNGK